MSDERRLVPLTEIPEEPIQWVWQDRIPLGAVTIIDGDPGESKSHLTYDLAARVTVGKPMPLCKGKSKKGGVVLIQAEDGMSAVVKPTIQAAGGDISKIRVYDRERFMEHALVLPDDMELIKTAVKEVKARLVVVDPLTHFIGGNPNSDVSVRKALGPLAALAEKENFAAVVVRHHNKGGSGNPLYRGSGSIGIIGLARSAYWVASDPSVRFHQEVSHSFHSHQPLLRLLTATTAS
jgi:RecA-family ATPase